MPRTTGKRVSGGDGSCEFGSLRHDYLGTMIVTTVLGALLVATTPVQPSPPVQATIAGVVEGDTIDVDISGTPETVRLIGIDTAEAGSPCGDAVTTFVTDLLPVGTPVTLTAGAVDDRDNNGHLLRYITFANPDDDPDVQGDEIVDLGGYLLGGGLAEPRYDSTDGYEPHPLEEAYHTIEAPPILPECGLDAVAPPPTTTQPPVQQEPTTTAEAAVPAEYHNALRTAEDYLDYTAFSESGLIDQLEYEQYSTEAAQWAVENVDVDWNEQAALSAAQYLDYTAFSEGGLRDQLEYEGFTPEQIDFAISEMKA
jgi:endonuclease YncB( thermonuclease family)